MNYGDQAINEQAIRNELHRSGLLPPDEHWDITPASGGLNTRVYVAWTDAGQPALTIRIRERHDRSSAEVDGLSDASGCPGVPRLRLLTNDLLVHDYAPGAPRRFRDLDGNQIRALGASLACIHATMDTHFTPWPEQSRRPGTRADLLRFRVGSLTNYDSYVDARAGIVHDRLPELLDRLPDVEQTDSSWEVPDFSRLHGDLSFGNILWHDDELALIDWEFSRIGDPAEDLAYLLVEQSADAEVGEPLRQAYIDAGGGERTWNRVPAYALFTATDSALWWADYARTHGKDARNEIEQRVEIAFRWLEP